MSDIEHKDLVTTNLHVPGRYQSSDPGLIGPGQYWVDTSRLATTGYVFLKIRNSTDSAWVPIAVGAMISADGIHTATAQQIRDHINDDTLHRVINDAVTSAVVLWSSTKIVSRLAPLDAHVANATLHRVINGAVVSATALWSSAKITAMLATKQNLLTAGQLVPAGSIITFAGEAIPAGYIHCVGGAVSRTVYAALFSQVGIAWGPGDGVTSFNVPSLMGKFLRMRDYGYGYDPDRAARVAVLPGAATGDAVGSYQGSQYASHRHGINTYGFNRTNFINTDRVVTPNLVGGENTLYSGGNETRPVNVYVNFGIKY